ncbi:MAG: hypothetical protein R3C26_23300 [Calditrichia bacterium]
MSSAFELRNIIKRYPDFQLGPLSLSVEPERCWVTSAKRFRQNHHNALHDRIGETGFR